MTPHTPPTAIGKIVKSNTHIDYVCQVYNLGEVEQCPQPGDYGFGTFVAIELDDGAPLGNRLVGVIYNTLLMNPDFGSLGPRLSPRQDLEIFTPDYLAETATLVGLIAVGWIDAQGVCRQGVPPQAATVNNRVTRLDDERIDRLSSRRRGQTRAPLRAAAAQPAKPVGPAAAHPHRGPADRAVPGGPRPTGSDAQ